MQAPDRQWIARRIESWFARHQRSLPWRSGYDPYHVWVSEVMLQQTRMEVVLPYFERFLMRFPTLAHLAAASDHDVTAAWSGLGYYRRARMLREGAAVVMERFGGTIPSSVDELRTIPGIGRYTAGAIASVAFEERAPIVDGNVARVVARVLADESEDPWSEAAALVGACRSPRDLNQGLMELGALVCKPKNPSCLLCPVRARCVALATGRVDELPPPKARAETRALQIPLYLVFDRHGRVLMRRESGPLMHAMLHLPHGNSALFSESSFQAAKPEHVGVFRHTVTNRRIEFTVYRAKARRPRGYEWIDPATLAELPHPSYVRKALEVLKSRNARA